MPGVGKEKIMEINLHFHEIVNQSISHKIDNLTRLVEQLLEKEIIMSEQMDKLTTEVTETITVQQSAVVLLQGLSAQIEALKTDPVALQALADSLDTSSNELAAAITANTPAE